jgi:NADPH:quinone reductase-like Zn-dependent oxidoreductase
MAYEQASTFPIAFFAAYQAMYNILPYGMGLTPLVPSGRDKYTNKPILILAGGGSYVGHFGMYFHFLDFCNHKILMTSEMPYNA